MPLRKYSKGKILKSDEEKEEQRVAAKHFSEKDRKELAEELAEDAPDDKSK